MYDAVVMSYDYMILCILLTLLMFAWRLNCMEFVDPCAEISLSYQVTLTVVIVVVANCMQA